MKIGLLILFFVLGTLLWSLTGENVANRIVIDCSSNDFTIDEEVIADTLGNTLESPSDSYWGEYNDIRQIKVTWDSDYLYLAVDACSWDNNVVLFIDIYDDYGIEGMQDINAWKRSFRFFNQNPDFFLATWDKNTDPQFWKMDEGSDLTAQEITSTEDCASFDTGNLDRSMEVKITWDMLYYGGYNGTRTMANFPRIKLVSLITSGNDNTSGPDCAPDNLGGMSEQANQQILIDNYAEILIDSDEDGLPDMNIKPNERVSFYKIPPVKPIHLKINEIKYPDGKILALTEFNSHITFSTSTNRSAELTAEIYNLEGKFIAFASQIDENVWQWNGKNSSGKSVPFGIYIVRVRSVSGEVQKISAFSVIK